MEKPQVKVSSIEVNIKAPEQLHVVRPHSAKRQKEQNLERIPQPIPQQTNWKQCQQSSKSSHKLKHIQSIEDKGEFIDQNQHKRLSDNDQAVETISRVIHPEQELPLGQDQLEKIAEEGVNEDENSKPLKHINMDNILDKDEFNLRNSREKDSEKKRRLSETNLEGYFQQNMHFPVVNYLNELQKTIPEKIIQEQSNLERRSKLQQSPANRRRKNSFHSAYHCNGVSQEIQRMIVDEIDKKKKTKKQDQKDEQDEDNQMEAIKEQKQQDDLVNTAGLEQARQKIENQIEVFSKVVGKQIGPSKNQHIYIEKPSPIPQEP